jgi:hypothetical protein
MIDYFLEAIIPENTDDIRSDIAELINSDINSYRDYMIRQYNGDAERATDEFCFKKFLNEYSAAINVFALHSEFNCKGSFNRYINYCWQVVNGYICIQKDCLSCANSFSEPSGSDDILRCMIKDGKVIKEDDICEEWN